MLYLNNIMKKISLLSLLLMVVSIVCSRVYAIGTDQIVPENNAADTTFQHSVNKSIKQLQSSQNKIKQNYQELNTAFTNREQFLVNSLDSVNHRISTLQDSVLNANANLRSYYKNLENNYINLSDKQTFNNNLVSGLVIVVLIISLIIGICLYRIRKTIQLLYVQKDSSSKTAIETINEEIAYIKNGIDGLVIQNKAITEENQKLLLCSLKDYNKTTESIVSGIQDIANKLSNVSRGDEPEKLAASQLKYDQVAYDAAVDTWLHINNHLTSMGKNRRKIPHVYALLAGHQVELNDLQSDLAQLDEERREEVNTIISDINRFKSQHIHTIEECGSIKAGSTLSLRDMVRFPLGEPFDNDLDEELTGESVENSEKITMVASLGYLFPGSRNGCYRVKAKVLV